MIARTLNAPMTPAFHALRCWNSVSRETLGSHGPVGLGVEVSVVVLVAAAVKLDNV